MSVPRAGDSCFTRKVFGGGPCLSRPLASPEDTVAPTSQEKLDSPSSVAEGGPPARAGWTHGQTGLPCGPTAGAAASHPGPGRGLAASAMEGLGPGLGARQGEGQAERGEVFIQECASEVLLFPPPFLKAKAIIYRSFRFAVCSLFELDIQTPPKGEGGLGAREETATQGEAVRRGGSLDAPTLPGS